MKLGMDTLTKKENVKIEKIFAHGGLFKSKDVTQRVLAAALNVPVALLETAGEGGAWGIALLAAYTQQTSLSLTEYLDRVIFADSTDNVAYPEAQWVSGYERFIQRYKAGLNIEREAAGFVSDI